MYAQQTAGFIQVSINYDWLKNIQKNNKKLVLDLQRYMMVDLYIVV